MSNKAKRIVRELFSAFRDDPLQLLPPEFQARAGDDTPRAIADYVAGMTDRYAIKEYRANIHGRYHPEIATAWPRGKWPY